MEIGNFREEREDCGWKEVYAINRVAAVLQEEDREIERLNKEIDELVNELAEQRKFAQAKQAEIAEAV